jgi:uncharacterized membrane protein
MKKAFQRQINLKNKLNLNKNSNNKLNQNSNHKLLKRYLLLKALPPMLVVGLILAVAMLAVAMLVAATWALWLKALLTLVEPLRHPTWAVDSKTFSVALAVLALSAAVVFTRLLVALVAVERLRLFLVTLLLGTLDLGRPAASRG